MAQSIATALASEDELRERTDENSETEDCENEHRRTISRWLHFEEVRHEGAPESEMRTS